MKKILFNYIKEENHGTEKEPAIVSVTKRGGFICSEANFEVEYAAAKRRAVPGTITVEDIPNPVTAPTEIEQLRADVDYIAMETGVEL